MTDHADLVIVGGGPVGAALALALRGSGLDVVVLEAQADFSLRPDPRTLALSYGSRQLLQRLGVWDALPAPTPIETIHVSQRGGFGRATLTAEGTGVPALGYTVNYSALNAALPRALLAGGIPCLTGATVRQVRSMAEYGVAEFDWHGERRLMTAKLLALADGGRSLAGAKGIEYRSRDYGQTAVACEVRADRPHRNIAYERLTPVGPMALLPLPDGFALVWATGPEEAETLLGLDDDAFLRRLQASFGDRAGRFASTGPRSRFPLALKRATALAPRLALIGNAAQVLHPAAGQGFNLGLRDAWELAREIRHTGPDELGADAMLARYRARRSRDVTGAVAFTDALVRVFSSDHPPLRHGRGLALAALDMLPPAKRFVAGKMIWGANGWI